MTHVNLDFYHSFISFDLKQSEKYRISVTRFTERFVPPSWMPVAPPGHEAARVFEVLDVCAGLTAAGSPFDFLQERLDVCESCSASALSQARQQLHTCSRLQRTGLDQDIPGTLSGISIFSIQSFW